MKEKRILSVFLAMLLLISALPFATLPTFAETSGDFEYSVLSEDEKTCEITGYNGSETDLEIPSQLDGYVVKSIGESAFYNCQLLTNITIPDSVTSVGDTAFAYCQSLINVTIGNNVTSIGFGAFAGCEVMTSIEISKSVTSIGDRAFLWCASLTNIDVAENNTAYSSENGVLFNSDKTKLLQYPIGKKDTSYDIPKTVTSLGNESFMYCLALTSIEIPESVTSIGDRTFMSCT